MTERTRKIVVIIITILLAAWMILAGVGKLMQPEEVLQMWDKWGYPAAFMMFIGVAEIAGSIGLFIPKFRKLAALGLIIIMIGAVVTHGINDEYSNLMGPIIAIFMLVLTIVLRRPIAQEE
ncbi:DoxX family protein [Sanyastnella coralliicola]|uniref:DoxX family protein n=1 Tax=Sanyastnella coralliicola TaxID=3069118 RepID=UPI0027BA6CBB|nr:DoxX family protein [Longitalea sp. SCSIO 12813]